MEQSQIIEAVQQLNKPTLAKIITRTLVRMNKFSKDKTSANPYKRIHRISTLIVELNPTHKNSVNEQHVVENKPDDFITGSHKWGKPIGHGVFERNGKLYVSVIVKNAVMVNHMTRDEIVDKTSIEGFIPKQSGSNKQKLDNLVAYRTFSLDNILSLQFI